VESLTIDKEAGAVYGSLGSYLITGEKENAIWFESSDAFGKWIGSIDRITGMLILEAKTSDGKIFVGSYSMACVPARPLF
jgi:hypothetical protein